MDSCNSNDGQGQGSSHVSIPPNRSNNQGEVTLDGKLT